MDSSVEVDDFVPALELALTEATKNRLRLSERRFTLLVHGLQAAACIDLITA